MKKNKNFEEVQDDVYEASFDEETFDYDDLSDRLVQEGFEKDNNRYVHEEGSDIWLLEDEVRVRVERGEEPEDWEYKAVESYLTGDNTSFDFGDWLRTGPMDYFEAMDEEDIDDIGYDVNPLADQRHTGGPVNRGQPRDN